MSSIYRHDGVATRGDRVARGLYWFAPSPDNSNLRISPGKSKPYTEARELSPGVAGRNQTNPVTFKKLNETSQFALNSCHSLHSI